MQTSTEELLEGIRKNYPNIRVKAGTAGFGIFVGHNVLVWPYTVFQRPEFDDELAKSITILEIMPCHCGHDEGLHDDWDMKDIIGDNK